MRQIIAIATFMLYLKNTKSACKIYTYPDILFGGMAHSLTQTPKTVCKKVMRHYGYFLLRISVVPSPIIFSVNLYFNKPFLKSKPGNLLLTTGLLAMAIVVYLPFSPFAGALGFSVAHVRQFLAIMVVLFLYLVTADWLKLAFFKWIERTRHANAQEKAVQHLMFRL